MVKAKKKKGTEAEAEGSRGGQWVACLWGENRSRKDKEAEEMRKWSTEMVPKTRENMVLSMWTEHQLANLCLKVPSITLSMSTQRARPSTEDSTKARKKRKKVEAEDLNREDR